MLLRSWSAIVVLLVAGVVEARDAEAQDTALVQTAAQQPASPLPAPGGTAVESSKQPAPPTATQTETTRAETSDRIPLPYRRVFRGHCGCGCDIQFHFVDKEGSAAYYIGGVPYVSMLEYKGEDPPGGFRYWKVRSGGHPGIIEWAISLSSDTCGDFQVWYHTRSGWNRYCCKVCRIVAR